MFATRWPAVDALYLVKGNQATWSGPGSGMGGRPAMMLVPGALVSLTQTCALFACRPTYGAGDGKTERDLLFISMI